MKIGFFGGVREIGGNIILLESNGVAIVFDFGRKFATSEVYFNHTTKGREEIGYQDYVDLGELPPFRGFYKEELPNSKSLPFEIAGIFFSHAHLDHIGRICDLNPNLDKYMTKGTHAVLNYFVDKSILPCKPQGIQLMDGSSIKIGDFSITPYFIDHDVPGAVAYLIETPKGLVVYTGDIYFKGPKSNLSYEFVKYVKSLKPFILINEGTRIGWNGIVSNTEEELKNQIKEVANVFDGLLIGNVYEIHLSRIKTFFDVSKELGKKFVIHEDYARTLTEFAKINEQFALEILNSENTFVFPGAYKTPLFLKEKAIDIETLRKEEQNTMLLLNFAHIQELIDIKPISNSAYIMSGGEPLSSVDPDNTRILENWLKLFNLPLFRIHSPGHASETEILWMAREINPDILLPIHTQFPERFKVVHNNVLILEKGVLNEF
ncbi:MAG: MBL fold metallo-hydrolase [Caldisericaceae bacterium]